MAGCMIGGGLDRAALDRWITREPPECDDERAPLRCSGCGKFLKQEPDGIHDQVNLRHCDGQPSVWQETHDEGVLAIIGDEFRDKPFARAAAPHCGGKTVSHVCGGQHEISPDEVEAYRHEPHFFEDDAFYDTRSEVRICAHCGTINLEPM
jgi:hypothetical protein